MFPSAFHRGEGVVVRVIATGEAFLAFVEVAVTDTMVGLHIESVSVAS